MPYQRFNLDLAILLDTDGNLPAVFSKKLNEVLSSTQLTSLANMTLIEVIKTMIRQFKQYAVKINEGKDNEEMTIWAVHHLCKHDIGQSCDPEEEI
jgi:hypothetical protein